MPLPLSLGAPCLERFLLISIISDTALKLRLGQIDAGNYGFISLARFALSCEFSTNYNQKGKL